MQNREWCTVKQAQQDGWWSHQLGTWTLCPCDPSTISELMSPNLQPHLLALPLCQATKASKSKLACLQIMQGSQHHTSIFSVTSVSKGRIRPSSQASTGIMVPNTGFKDAAFILNPILAITLPQCRCHWPIIYLKPCI